MAKDELGHGSNARGTGAQGMRLVKTHVLGPHSAKVYKNPEWNEIVVKTFRNGAYQSKNDYHTDDMADAHGTAQSQLNRWADQDAKSRPVGSGQASSELASGAKSATIPTHDSMGGEKIDYAKNPLGLSRSEVNADGIPNVNRRGYGNEYNAGAVNNAIAAQNRSGRGKIGGREAKMIHALLKGR